MQAYLHLFHCRHLVGHSGWNPMRILWMNCRVCLLLRMRKIGSRDSVDLCFCGKWRNFLWIIGLTPGKYQWCWYYYWRFSELIEISESILIEIIVNCVVWVYYFDGKLYFGYIQFVLWNCDCKVWFHNLRGLKKSLLVSDIIIQIHLFPNKLLEESFGTNMLAFFIKAVLLCNAVVAYQYIAGSYTRYEAEALCNSYFGVTLAIINK